MNFFVPITFCMFLIFCTDFSASQTHTSGHFGSNGTTGLECYTCVYIEGSKNMSHDGCEKDHPPAGYKRKDCFGFGNLNIAGSIRHSSHGQAHSSSGIVDPLNVHCTTISGKTDDGSKIIFRGCDIFPEYNQSTTSMKCFTKKEFDFPLATPEGFRQVRNVEKCFCKKDGCNGSSALIGVLGLTIIFPSIILIMSSLSS